MSVIEFGAPDEPSEVDLWPEPKPLPEVLPPVAPFDPKILPDSVRAFIVDVAERMQCPIDYPAVAMMIVLAGALGRKLGIRPKRRDDWTVISNLWGVSVGRPGLMKTPAISEPMKFLKRLEIEAKQRFEEENAEHLAGALVAKASMSVAEQAIRKAIKDGSDPNEIARNALAQEQEQPARSRYLLNDPTVEKLGEILNQNPNGVTLARDELYAFLKSLDKEGHEGARGFYLEAWNGNGRYTYDRIGRGTIDIEAACVSMIGTIQPSRLAEYVSSAVRGGSGDDGLIQRFQLAVWPDCPSRWQNVDRWPDSDAKRIAFDAVCLLDDLVAENVGAVRPDDDDAPYLRFDRDAQTMFNRWQKQLENRLRSDELPPALESHLAKYRSLIPSLALLTHLADDGTAEIPVESLTKAIQWGQYLESHACRLYAAAVHSDITAGRALAKKIRDGSLADGFTVKDVYRPGWSGLASSEEAQAAIELLVDLDWLEVAEIPTAGRKRTEHRINPRLRQKHPGRELPELPKDPSGSFGSTPEEASQDSETQF
jgi:putative DNA primase/helicase